MLHGDHAPEADSAGRRRVPTTRARQPVRRASRASSRVLFARSTSRSRRIPARFRKLLWIASALFLRRAHSSSPRVSSACRAPRRARRWRNPRTNRSFRPDLGCLSSMTTLSAFASSTRCSGGVSTKVRWRGETTSREISRATRREERAGEATRSLPSRHAARGLTFICIAPRPLDGIFRPRLLSRAPDRSFLRIIPDDKQPLPPPHPSDDVHARRRGAQDASRATRRLRHRPQRRPHARHGRLQAPRAHRPRARRPRHECVPRPPKSPLASRRVPGSPGETRSARPLSPSESR